MTITSIRCQYLDVVQCLVEGPDEFAIARQLRP
jgi:hypothetical protein